MPRPRLLLADDHNLLVEGIQRLLSDEFDLVATAADGRAALAAYPQYQPDLVILDVGLPLLNGIEVARLIRAQDPEARILFVTMHTERAYLEQAFQTGARGYVAKQAGANELLLAIKNVLAGQFYVSPMIKQKWGTVPFDATRNPQNLFGGRLTSRQREVLQLIAEGLSMKEMAGVLNVSVRTIEFHKNSIVQELGLKTTAELTRYALENGITTR